ncbi:ATP-binding cassette domain-containing protein [Mucilaginibacter sp. RCC_168]|uniref:ATP-binding cassette domain-containing protein n=1 Tax=Mucilaginibacter sp. RCC_168 TaxID=3239221 RepID=UPI003525EF70
MEIFKILQNKSKYFYLFLIALGLTNAVWNNALLLLINSKITNVPLPYFKDNALLIFIVLIIISYFVSRFFQTFMLKMTVGLSYDSGILLFQKVRLSSYEDFKNYGSEKVYSYLQDTEIISQFPNHFIETFNSIIILIVGLVYLSTVSLFGALAVYCLLAILGFMYYFRTQETQKIIDKTRALTDDYHKNIHDLLNGFKEIKMSTVKSENLFDELDKNRNTVKELTIIASVKWLNNELLGRYFWFILIGVILYVLPQYFAVDSKMVTGFIITLLFLMGPIASLIAFIPYYSRMKASMKKLNEFDLQIDWVEGTAGNNAENEQLNEDFSSLNIRDLVYFYDGNKDQFSIKVEHMVISSGELIFITGGNGSGKTTFLNILVGLLRPTSGQIFFNGHLITKNNYANYRNRIAVVFADNYMLSQNYDDFEINHRNKELLEYITLMKINEIVTINEEKNKLDIELSKGQQKRISLIYALLENKDLLVLDEWAADQDPFFRSYFYNYVLQDLKMRGKTVIIVTHDDMYYPVADRIIKFNFGETETKLNFRS